MLYNSLYHYIQERAKIMRLIKDGVYYMEGRLIREKDAFRTSKQKSEAVAGTMSYGYFPVTVWEKRSLSLKPTRFLWTI